MRSSIDLNDVASLADAIDSEVQALSIRNTSAMRAIRRGYTRLLQQAGPDVVLQLAQELLFLRIKVIAGSPMS